jgi:hypothetical protein
MNVPLYWVTATVARLMMSKMWLMVYHPFQRQDGGTTLPPEIKEKLFITSLENIEYSMLLETEGRTMKWGWLFKTYVQWHALAFILSELCQRTTGDLVDRAWLAVEQTREGRWGEGTSEDDSRGHLWRPLRKLYLKAKDARKRGLQEELLVKHRASGVTATRTYSPNANPMFGHPKIPTVVRAPLSQAQLQRFTQGPVYGQRPLDSHELLKSPRLALAGGVDADSRLYRMNRAAPMGTQGEPVYLRQRRFLSATPQWQGHKPSTRASRTTIPRLFAIHNLSSAMLSLDQLTWSTTATSICQKGTVPNSLPVPNLSCSPQILLTALSPTITIIIIKIQPQHHLTRCACLRLIRISTLLWTLLRIWTGKAGTSW